MSSGTKTDNSQLEAKLILRRYFLDKYHSKSKPNVLDCCQGEGLIWDRLRTEYECDYWGVDIKGKRGRLKVDSVKILAAPNLPQNVYDIDTYGSPWKHWAALIPQINQPTTVFLTIGHFLLGGASYNAAEMMGLGKMKRLLPGSLLARITKDALPYVIGRLAARHGLTVTDAKEVLTPKMTGMTMRYVGVHLTPEAT